MRIEFFKLMVETEVGFEYLTEYEQLELINKLIQDVNQTHPQAKLQLIRMKEYDGSLDW